MRARPVVDLAGPSARLHYATLRTAFALLPIRRGYRKLTRAVARVFGPDNRVTIRHEHGFRFEIQLSDPYWARMIMRSQHYEPDVQRMIGMIAPHVDLFVDCGANKGFWTAWAAQLFDHVIAIEASPSTFAMLARNAAQGNVTLHNRAIFSEDGQTVDIVKSDIFHAETFLSRTAPDWKGTRGDGRYVEQVETIRLDTVIPQGRPALVKLDVEGAEIEAFRGAERAILDGALFIYEDHARDLQSATTRYLMDVAGLSVFCESDGLRPVRDLAELARLKARHGGGANFVAARADSPILRKLGLVAGES